MRHRILAKSGIPLIVCGLIISIRATGQAPAASKAQSQSLGKNAVTKKWRTPWGDPDLQGPWSNTNLPPLERPAKYGDREFMTTHERAEEEAKRVQGEKGSFYDPSYADGRTSLIYDPPDGKIPALTPEGKKREADESLRGDGPYDGPEDIQGSTKNLHLVERWKRTADNQIDYRFTVSDPETWTKPWSAAIPWHASGPLFEYACHEDNIDMYGILTGARAAEHTPPKRRNKVCRHTTLKFNCANWNS
jgi:hypothetical protein